MNFNELPPSVHNNPGKYKTMLCKHFQSPKGCSFGDKCQFAHGMKELRTPNGVNPMMAMNNPEHKKGPNTQNYKIVKCKYWEKDGTCRYGTLCTFAHGDNELRTKSDNMMMGNMNSMGNQSPMYPMGMMGFDPNMAMMMQNMMQYQQQNPEMMKGFLGMNDMPMSGQPYEQQNENP